MSEPKYTRVETMSQQDGTVFLGDEADTVTMMIDKDNTMGLLNTVLNAIRIEGDTEKLRACAMTCKAMIGMKYF